ncbi:hypothetical protein I4F81_000958 [Pyropia yezoensis]|uniref:Uncharacterized protein n=1 Tax=Pyropia yezoensis TaxID=2788 RepID=A0ACC3BKS7_PYRYE|nr:hypothetical protein I4F81_000958 [Neopyropia yezoensis]
MAASDAPSSVAAAAIGRAVSPALVLTLRRGATVVSAAAPNLLRLAPRAGGSNGGGGAVLLLLFATAADAGGWHDALLRPHVCPSEGGGTGGGGADGGAGGVWPTDSGDGRSGVWDVDVPPSPAVPTTTRWTSALSNSSLQALQPRSAPPPLSPAAFETKKLLGSGSSGNVFLVAARDTGELFAMKVIPKASLTSSPECRRHALDERLVMEVTRPHPFVLPLRYAFQSPRKLYMVMDSGHVRIADFGLSKLLSDEGAGLTKTLCGTRHYCAPEAVAGHAYGQSCDVWSLGVLAYELLCGQTPFHAEEINDVFVRILTADIEYPPHLTPTAISLISGLLTRPLASRLGCGPGGLSFFDAAAAMDGRSPSTASSATADQAVRTPNTWRGWNKLHGRGGGDAPGGGGGPGCADGPGMRALLGGDHAAAASSSNSHGTLLLGYSFVRKLPGGPADGRRSSVAGSAVGGPAPNFLSRERPGAGATWGGGRGRPVDSRPGLLGRVPHPNELW